jgi:hypothetical protein
MSNKLEALKELREYVDERKHIQFNYIQEKEDGYVSYDALGRIAQTFGVSDETLKALDGDEISSDDLNVIAFAQILIDQGFTREELETIQELNDTAGSVEELIDYIDKLIEES